MERTPVHPKGWTEQDDELVAEFIASVKKQENKRKKAEWREKKETEAGQRIQMDYYAGRNNPRDMPAIQKNSEWANEQGRTARPFGYYEKQQRKQNVIIFFVSVLVVLLFLKFLISSGYILL
jgi:hypothetical protein